MKTYVGKPQTIKEINQNIILNTIASNPNISQTEVAEKVGLSLSTVNKVVRGLEETRLIICTGNSDFTGGRRSKVYRVNEDSGYIVSVYIQEETFYCRVSNIVGKKVSSETIAYDPSMSWLDNLLNNLEITVRDIDKERISIIGVAVPGTVTKGRIFNTPAIPEWEGIHLQGLIEEHYSCTILIENDIKSATMGACSSFLTGEEQNMVYISILKHIGSAIIINRELYNSANSFAGELAYMAVSEGEKTTDQTGCADLVLSEAIRTKNKAVLVDLVAKLIVNVTCVIDPSAIVIATPHLCMEDQDLLTASIAKYIHEGYIPKIIIDQVVIEKNIAGLVTICRNKIETAMKIVKS